MGEVPFGYREYNGKVVPDYDVARSVAVGVVLEQLGIAGLREVDGKNGKEFKGACPFGESHGKNGCFSINMQSGAFMCHACKRKGSHVLRFVEVYIETNRADDRFEKIGTQAAAEWLVALAELRQESGEDEPVDVDDGKPVSVVESGGYGREKVDVFLGFTAGALFRMFQNDADPMMLGQAISDEIMLMAAMVAEDKAGERDEE
jgi:hypothetical protein